MASHEPDPARVVQCAPKVALALGYDVEEALE